MSTAWLDHPGACIHLRSQRLEVVPPQDAGSTPLTVIPLLDLERLLLTEQVQITSQALAAVLRQNAPVHLLDHAGRELGSFLPPDSPDGRARLRQYARSLDQGWMLERNREVVIAKIFNQRRLLQKLRANRPRPVETAIDHLEAALRLAGTANSLDSLRGAEGAASAAYFPAWATFLPEEFPFQFRSTRPPHNPANACLSFGYTLLYQEMTASIHACGLDPALGGLHVTEQNRWSLALDLLEPFRPAIVDALTIRLFSHALLGTADFEPHDGGVYLAASGRRIFLQQWEARLEREFFSEHAAHRTTLRQQVREAAQNWKRSVLEETPAANASRPFQLN